MSRPPFATLALVATTMLGSGCRVIVELIETNPHGDDTTPDASPPQSDPRCRAWSHPPDALDLCDVAIPQAPLDLTDGAWTFDTNSGALTDPNDDATFPTSTLVVANDLEARALSVESFSLSAGATLRVRGKRPLIVVSWTDADLRGVIDLTSRSGAPGAGSNPEICAATTAGNGGDNTEGAGGGGGGGFGTNGAAGGTGYDGQAAAGSAGGIASTAALRGGCAGGSGGNALRGTGGDGGGALLIAARESITLTGVLAAGGAGGGAAQGGRGGGGGGGSGGYIGLTAASLVLEPSAIIAANGGGGGGGSDNSPASAGQDGLAGATPAAAGPGQGMGSSGGAGGARGVAPKSGVSSHRGGGGGGGAVGVVRLDCTTQNVAAGATISPAP